MNQEENVAAAVAAVAADPSFALFRDGSGELLLTIVSYLNVAASNRLAATCRRAYYWVHQYRRLRGPELVAAAASNNNHNNHRRGKSGATAATTRTTAATAAAAARQEQPLSNEALVQQALAGLQAPPDLCLSFQTNRNASFSTALLPKLPTSTICLGVQSTHIQSVLHSHMECHSPASLFLGTLPSQTSCALPFFWHTPEQDDDEECPEWTDRYLLPQLRRQQQAAAAATDDGYWKVMIVYVTHGGSSEVENFLAPVQQEFPRLQIVGGICQGGFISQRHDTQDNDWSEYTSHELVDYLQNMGIRPNPNTTNSRASLVQQVLRAIESHPYHLCHVGESGGSTGASGYGEGIFGIVLGGDVPVHTVVSRGVKSNVTHGPPTPTSDFVVHDAVYHVPSDEAYMFQSGPQDHDLPPYHMIHSIRDRHTGQVVTVPNFIQQCGAADLVGLRQADQDDGFCLHMPHPLSRNLGGFIFFQDTTMPRTSLQNYQIDLYTLDGTACRQDVHKTLEALQQEVSQQTLLGGCMFSCAARGPAPNMLGERMADAAAWAKHFPTVPLLGWYAGGELGPVAMAGRQHALRGRDTAQRATLQGFTAVFALWIVPVIDWRSIHLDDADETVQAFCRKRLVGSN